MQIKSFRVNDVFGLKKNHVKYKRNFASVVLVNTLKVDACNLVELVLSLIQQFLTKPLLQAPIANRQPSIQRKTTLQKPRNHNTHHE